MDINFASPNQRTPCVLVIDCSGSMSSATKRNSTRMEEVNEGMRRFAQELQNDDTAKTRVQLAIVTIGGPIDDAALLLDWTDAVNFQPSTLTASGTTPLGKGMRIALQLVEHNKALLRANGISYTRPWIFVMTDGERTDSDDDWNAAVAECRAAEAGNKCMIFPIAVDGANKTALAQISATPVADLDAAKFREFFVWLTGTLGAAVRSRPGEMIQLPSSDPWRAVRA